MLTEKSIDRESQQKLYVQVFSIIKEKIEHGKWPAGSQIPTEDELCRRYDVSKATVRMAVAELVRSGFLRKQQGRGTFVAAALENGITMKTRLTEDIFGEGVVAKKEVLVKGWKAPPEDIKIHLRTSEEVYYILCKRIVDGEPAFLEESFVPRRVMPDIEDAEICQQPFYELMQEKGKHRIHKIVQMIELSGTDADAAAILKVTAGSALLLVHRLLVGANHERLAYTRLLGSGRKYKLQMELVQME
jgi:DNA-binding GntR family transcriptional regulator